MIRIAGALRTALRKCSETEVDESVSADAADLPILTQKGISVLAECQPSPELDDLAQAVIADRTYYGYLLDVELNTLEDCLRAARILARADTWFIAGLIRASDERDDSKSMMRALEILTGLEQAGVAAQWIRRLTGHSDANVRSKAVKLLSTLYVNLSLIEKQLESADPRVRANAIEGVWGETSHRHTQMLDRATKDPHHRVAVNGLYGLYVAQVAGTAERMIHVAHSPSAKHRAAIAWAMGKTKSDEFTLELEKLADDADDCVRLSAARALAQVRSAELATAAVG